MGDLDEHFARLGWVRREIDRLDEEVTAYTQSDPLEVYWHYDLARHNPCRTYQVRLREGPPEDVAIHSGVILNEMRAILDALAVTLAARNGYAASTDTYFPTAKSENGFQDARVQKKFKKIGAADQLTIEALKPWLGGNDMLYALHSSDIIRKHQRLLVLAGNTQSTRLGSEGGWTLDGSKLHFINAGPGHSLNEPLAKVAADYELPIRQVAVVAFSEPEAIKSKPLVATLNDFASLVESILKLFVR